MCFRKVYKIEKIILSMVKKEGVKVNADNSSGVAGVVFGILSIIFALLTPVIGIISAIVGLVFSLKQSKASKNKWSKAGIILNVVGIIVSLLILVLIIKLLPSIISNILNQQGL